MTEDRHTVSKSILDVGCGQNKFEGAIGLDSNPRSHADVIHDLGAFPYPFEPNQFAEVMCRHVGEHVLHVSGFVTELHRITKPGGRLKIVTPHYSNPDWATDPTHRNHFNSYSFNCFVPDLTPFPFYTDVELRPRRTYVSLANLWRVVGLEWLINLDQKNNGLRFLRKFWEFYLSTLVRGKELHFDFEVVKNRREPSTASRPAGSPS